MADIAKSSKSEWQISQRLRTKLFSDEDAVLRSASRALLESQAEVWRQMVVGASTAGEISMGRHNSHSGQSLSS